MLRRKDYFINRIRRRVQSIMNRVGRHLSQFASRKRLLNKDLNCPSGFYNQEDNEIEMALRTMKKLKLHRTRSYNQKLTED